MAIVDLPPRRFLEILTFEGTREANVGSAKLAF